MLSNLACQRLTATRSLFADLPPRCGQVIVDPSPGQTAQTSSRWFLARAAHGLRQRSVLFGHLKARTGEPSDTAEDDPENEAGYGGHDNESMCQRVRNRRRKTFRLRRARKVRGNEDCDRENGERQRLFEDK